MNYSIVEYYSEHEGYRCGYCRNSDSGYSYGMWAHALTVSDYQDLIDRGWRRSGKYCYKPTMDVTCCPMYTIRCRALEFKASKSQKKILKRFNKFLMGQDLLGSGENAARKMSVSNNEVDDISMCEEVRDQFYESEREPQKINLEQLVDSRGEECGDIEEETKGTANVNTLNRALVKENLKQKDVKKVAGPDPTKTACKKAKQIRRERKLEKLREKGIDVSTICGLNKNKEKQIEDFINDLPKDVKHKLVIKLVRTSPPSPGWVATAKESHRLYVKYQMAIHGDKVEKCAESKFREFLVDSPLLEKHSETGPSCGYGSFHQQYWLDGKLMAVGVIDILPKCVSSVYFFYDPQYMPLTLGTYGALREIAFTRKLYSVCSEFKYYYMGYYIHSCTKMRYKGNFHPSDLACPETYKWVPIEDCLPKLDAEPYSRLDPDIDSIDTDIPKDIDFNSIPVWLKGVVMPYKKYIKKLAKAKRSELNDELAVYGKLVGSKIMKSLVLARSN